MTAPTNEKPVSDGVSEPDAGLGLMLLILLVLTVVATLAT